jgi:hypothetical protein
MFRRFQAIAFSIALSGCANIIIDQPNGPQPPGMPPVQVAVSIEITKSVYGRSASINGSAVNLAAFSSTVKAGTTNTDVLTGMVPLAPGSYTLTVQGTYDQWDGTASPISQTSSFTVTAATPTASVTLAVSPATGDILVPRNGSSPPITFSVTRMNSSAMVNISAPDLPSGVTLPAVSIPGTATSASANLSAGATANGRTNTHFTAKMAGATDAVQAVGVQVVPVAGTVSWVAAPFLGATGPATPTSPDGRFKVTASRIGAQRVWTLHIASTSNAANSLDVTAAQWGGTGGSSLAGIAFCPSTTATTLSALVLSDEDEDPNTTFHAPSVTYRLKVIRLDTGTPKLLTGTIDGLFYRNAIQPWLGFSRDCSIVAGWTTDATGSSARTVTFVDIFNGQATAMPFSFMDTGTQPAASLAAISGANINLTPPTGAVQTKPVP